MLGFIPIRAHTTRAYTTRTNKGSIGLILTRKTVTRICLKNKSDVLERESIGINKKKFEKYMFRTKKRTHENCHKLHEADILSVPLKTLSLSKIVL